MTQCVYCLNLKEVMFINDVTGRWKISRSRANSQQLTNNSYWYDQFSISVLFKSLHNLKVGLLFFIQSVSCRGYMDRIGVSLVTHQPSVSHKTHQIIRSWLFLIQSVPFLTHFQFICLRQKDTPILKVYQLNYVEIRVLTYSI